MQSLWSIGREANCDVATFSAWPSVPVPIGRHEEQRASWPGRRAGRAPTLSTTPRDGYAIEDYAFWTATETFEIHSGLFGENLTVQGLDLRSALVGERWRVGTALLEVAQPRLPCFKLGIRVGDPEFPKRFQLAVRPGAYLRIIETGILQAGDTVRVTVRPDHGVTMAMMVESLRQPAKALALLAAPQLPAGWRGKGERST